MKLKIKAAALTLLLLLFGWLIIYLVKQFPDTALLILDIIRLPLVLIILYHLIYLILILRKE